MHHIQYSNNLQPVHENKSISWCKKRTLYQNGGGLRPSYGSPHDFSSPSYFEGLGEEEGSNPLEDEEDLNTVLQSYLESASFSDGQSSSSPSQQSTDSGFAGDGYSTPSSNISYYNPNSTNGAAQAAQPQQAAYGSEHHHYYNNFNNNTASTPNGYYHSDYAMTPNNHQAPGFNNNSANTTNNSNNTGNNSNSFGASFDPTSYVQQQEHSTATADDDFHSSEDLSVIVDQVLNSIDEAQFDTSNYGSDYSALIDEGPSSSLLTCDHCGTPNLNKECKNCEMSRQLQIQPQQQQQQPQQQQQQQQQQQPPSQHSTESLKQNEGSFSVGAVCQKKSSKTVAAVQPMQRSVGVVEPRVVVKIPINKIRSSSPGKEEDRASECEEKNKMCFTENPEPVIDPMQETVNCIQTREEDPPLVSDPLPPPSPMEDDPKSDNNSLSYSKDLMDEVVKELEVEDFSESFKLSSSEKKTSSLSSSYHNHHKKKKHKRKKKKLCKCGGSKKRKRCETPTSLHSSPHLSSDSSKHFVDAMEESVSRLVEKNEKQVNPLKIVRISNSENEEFKIKDSDDENNSSSSLDCPVLERQVYDVPSSRIKNDDDSFGRNNGSLLSFRDLALKAAAAEEGDNVMYSNEEDEGREEEEENQDEPPPPSLTPPPPTLHRHDSPEPCDKDLLQLEEQTPNEESFKHAEDSKEELVDLLADLPSVLPSTENKVNCSAPPRIEESVPKIKVETPEPIKEEKSVKKESPESSNNKTKMLLEKDPEDEWLYCQTKHCHFWTRKPKRMERHKRTHAGTEEDMYYVCPDCFAKFYSLAKMLKHDRKFHTGEKDYECKICEAEVTDIHVHMRVHRADKEFRCSTCPLTFRHKNSLVRHVFQHSGERPYKCQTCNSGFFSLSKLKEHIRRRHSIQCEPQQPPAPPIQAPTPPTIKTEGLLRQYPKLAPRLNNAADDDVVIVGLKPAPAHQQSQQAAVQQQARSLTLPAGAANSRAILAAPSSIILPPQPAPQGVMSYLAQGPNGSVYLVTNPAPGANLFLGQGGEGILMPQQPLFIPQSPVLIPQQSQAPHGSASILQSNSNSTLFVVPTPVLNVPTATAPAPAPAPPPPPSASQAEKKLDILQQAVLEIPDHFQSFEEE